MPGRPTRAARGGRLPEGRVRPALPAGRQVHRVARHRRRGRRRAVVGRPMPVVARRVAKRTGLSAPGRERATGARRATGTPPAPEAPREPGTRQVHRPGASRVATRSRERAGAASPAAAPVSCERGPRARDPMRPVTTAVAKGPRSSSPSAGCGATALRPVPAASPPPFDRRRTGRIRRPPFPPTCSGSWRRPRVPTGATCASGSPSGWLPRRARTSGAATATRRGC